MNISNLLTTDQAPVLSLVSLNPLHTNAQRPLKLQIHLPMSDVQKKKRRNDYYKNVFTDQTPAFAAKQGGLKAKRRRASPEQITILTAIYNRTMGFPSSEVRHDLALNLQMTPRAVQIWFQNKRQLEKKSLASPNRYQPTTPPSTPYFETGDHDSFPSFDNPLLSADTDSTHENPEATYFPTLSH